MQKIKRNYKYILILVDKNYEKKMQNYLKYNFFATLYKTCYNFLVFCCNYEMRIYFESRGFIESTINVFGSFLNII